MTVDETLRMIIGDAAGTKHEHNCKPIEVAAMFAHYLVLCAIHNRNPEWPDDDHDLHEIRSFVMEAVGHIARSDYHSGRSSGSQNPFVDPILIRWWAQAFKDEIAQDALRDEMSECLRCCDPHDFHPCPSHG